MQPSIDSPRKNSGKWVYVSLRVRDGDRVLKPSHVGPDDIRFFEPPRLTSAQIEVIITNGDFEDRQFVTVLPHEADATLIPIRLQNKE
jgi:hypothetical protein